jgi:sulfate/thiosulfate transport system permease protein
MPSSRSVLPGFNLTLGYTLFYLGLIVLIPLAGVFLVTAGMTWEEFTRAAFNPQVVHSYKVSFGASLAAASVNAVFGLILAWVLVRYPFPGKRVVDALVDLPFALPTAVAGIALAAIYAPNGWIGQWAQPLYAGFVGTLNETLPWVPWTSMLGERLAYDLPGIFIALTFIGLPFVVRTVQPVLEDLEPEFEEAAATLGATRLQTLRHVILPAVLPALITGFAMAFARALGEYGSVVFIAGNMPFRSEITPVLIVSQLEQFQYTGATAIATVMLVASFLLLLGINLLQRWTRRHQAV